MISSPLIYCSLTQFFFLLFVPNYTIWLLSERKNKFQIINKLWWQLPSIFIQLKSSKTKFVSDMRTDKQKDGMAGGMFYTYEHSLSYNISILIFWNSKRVCFSFTVIYICKQNPLEVGLYWLMFSLRYFVYNGFEITFSNCELFDYLLCEILFFKFCFCVRVLQYLLEKRFDMNCMYGTMHFI